jgi:hypothetical protein
MNLALHWLRRDLRRHALPLFAWLLLVAAFTAARLWFRQQADMLPGDLEMQLDVPATALGFAEVCLLLRVLLDDPARGTGAFWKTRPPSGASVFAAKAVLIVLVSLAVPLGADAVFVALAGPSGGGAERLSLYFMPPAIALMAGAAAANWKQELVWLPVTVVLGMAGFVAVFFTVQRGWIADAADVRIMAAALLLTAAGWALCCWRGRGKWRATPVLACVLPPLATWGAACTDWHPERNSRPPRGADANSFRVQWHPSVAPQLSGSHYKRGQHTLVLPLHVRGLPAGTTIVSALRRVRFTLSGNGSFSAPVGRVAPARYRGERVFGESDPGFSAWLSPEDAAALRDRAYDVSGTLRLFFYDRKPQAIPLNGTTTIREGGCWWKLTPFAPFSLFGHREEDSRSSWWRQTEFVSTWPSVNDLREAFIDPTSARYQPVDGAGAIKLDTSYPHQSLNLWVGRGLYEERVSIADATDGERDVFRRLTAPDSAARESWEMHFDVMVYAGMLDVPFVLHWPPGQQP